MQLSRKRCREYGKLQACQADFLDLVDQDAKVFAPLAAAYRPSDLYGGRKAGKSAYYGRKTSGS
ncbi:MAG: hypothetical protein ACLUD2_16395 [Clostridium sp.]